MNNNPIGIIDSGVGGLSVASSLITNLPSESFIYLGDSLNCPYSQKSKKEIFDLTKKMIDFLITQQVKLIVIACNTITVTCIEDLRKTYSNLPLVGIVPVIKTAAKISKNKKIGIFSTKVTAQSTYQKDLIAKFHNDCEVINEGSADLVPMIEKNDIEGIDRVLGLELLSFKKSQIDTLALGCSHFPLIKDKIQQYLPKVAILDSGEAVSHQVKRILNYNDLESKQINPTYNFYTTGNLKSVKYFLNKLTIKAKISKIALR